RRTAGMHTVSAREYGYDAYERLLHVENERGERYTFERDPNGEVIAERGFDGQERRYERDMDGTVLVTHLPDGTTIHHQHDLAGRLTYSRYPDGSWEAWEYDRAGRLCKASNPHGETLFERDALGRIIREIQNGHAIEHCYDSRSRLTHTLSDLGADVSYGYDDAGLPESVKAIVQGMPHPWEARLQHDRLGRETLRTMTGGVACAMQYDGVGRPSRPSVTRGGHSLYNRGYRWDDDFRLSHAHDAISGRIVRYFYDDFGSLAEAEYGDGARQWRNPDVMGNVYDSTDRTDRTYARGGQLREDRR
ncbi:YD repeat protein (3 repeats), partial [Prevotella sp. oral taxon 317 str. F0108]